MRLSHVRSAAAASAVLAALLLSGCTSDADEPTEPATETATEEAPEAQDEPEESGPVEVPDVTLLILETAQGNLMRAGLEYTIVDAAGQPVAVDDASAYRVVAQDPAEGTVEPGQTVTLTVEPRG